MFHVPHMLIFFHAHVEHETAGDPFLPCGAVTIIRFFRQGTDPRVTNFSSHHLENEKFSHKDVSALENSGSAPITPCPPISLIPSPTTPHNQFQGTLTCSHKKFDTRPIPLLLLLLYPHISTFKTMMSVYSVARVVTFFAVFLSSGAVAAEPKPEQLEAADLLDLLKDDFALQMDGDSGAVAAEPMPEQLEAIDQPDLLTDGEAEGQNAIAVPGDRGLQAMLTMAPTMTPASMAPTVSATTSRDFSLTEMPTYFDTAAPSASPTSGDRSIPTEDDDDDDVLFTTPPVVSGAMSSTVLTSAAVAVGAVVFTLALVA